MMKVKPMGMLLKMLAGWVRVHFPDERITKAIQQKQSPDPNG